jgi:hypothetical protein
MTPIMLSDLIKIDDPTQYKLHLGCTSDGNRPLDEYADDRDKWLAWNRWRGTKDDWSRDFIFSFIEFYPLKDAWMFGGVFRVIARHDPGPDGYDLERIDEFDKYEGRLICQSSSLLGRRGQGRAFLFEKHMNSFDVIEILHFRYDGAKFPGYENINISFAELKPIIRREKQDWKYSLSPVKGVYLITDTSTGKYYVGSAYGGDGIWSRLSSYINTGHGWDQGLTDLLKDKEEDYAIKNFKFSLLETFTFTTPDQPILDRETYWKKVLMSRDFGHYNRN